MQAVLRLQPVRIVLLALVAALAVLTLSRLVELPLRDGPVAADRSVRLLASAPASYAEALERANDRLATAQDDARQRGGEWIFLERLATAHVARARLTGSFDDYVQAQAALDRAFAVAAPGAGPHLSQAELHFQMHRLGDAERFLKLIDAYALAPDREEQAEIMALRGDIDFYRGRANSTAARYKQATQLADSPAIAFRAAVLAWRTGDLDAADADFARALAMQRFVAPQMLANIALQRGALDLSRGRLNDDAAHIAAARKAFPGHWLADAHAAQLTALRGDLPRAAMLFEAVVRRTNDPIAMDALAAIHRALGNRETSDGWAGRAGALWEQRLKRFPEAAYGHAAEHHLAFGDPARALDLARKDFAARPYGGAAVGLAWALLANRRPGEALAALAAAERSGWVSADRHLAAAQAQALLGNSDEAEAERASALALNPRALDRSASLIWFH